MAAGKDWDRLAEFVRERRVELGMTQEDARAAGGPSTATMRLIEGALQQSYQPATLRDLEKALHWERGSVSIVLAGGEPVLSAGTQRGFDADDLPDDDIPPQSLAAFQDYADDFKLKLARARRRYPGQRLTGAMVFPLSPMYPQNATYQQLWDLMASLGWRPDGIPRSMAAMLVIRDEQAGGESATSAGLAVVRVT